MIVVSEAIWPSARRGRDRPHRLDRVREHLLGRCSGPVAEAEKLARATAGCGDACKLSRMEGSRGIINETISFTFQGAGAIRVASVDVRTSRSASTWCDATKQ